MSLTRYAGRRKRPGRYGISELARQVRHVGALSVAAARLDSSRFGPRGLIFAGFCSVI